MTSILSDNLSSFACRNFRITNQHITSSRVRDDVLMVSQTMLGSCDFPEIIERQPRQILAYKF